MKAVAYITMVALVSGCAVASPPPVPAVRHDAAAAADHESPELARFMRELVNVPFSFAMLERDGAQRPLRLRRAALVLQDAVGDLAGWQDPPVASVEGRQVFYAYAESLERQVALLELATRRNDTAETGERLEDIRETCNGCHRFFRPASAISHDVFHDRIVVAQGGQP